MAKLYSSLFIVKILKEHGFEFVSQKGSHGKFRKYGEQNLTVIVPMERKEIPIGTFKSILKQSNLTPSNFD